MKEKLNILVECYAQASILLDQFSVVLKSLPEVSARSASEPEFDLVLSDSPITRCYNNTDDFRELYKKVKAIMSTVDEQKTSLYKLTNATPKKIGDSVEFNVVSQSHIDITNEVKMNLTKIIDSSDAILNEYNFKLTKNIFNDYKSRHPLLRGLENLVKYLKETVIELDKLDQPVDQEMDDLCSTTIVTQVEDIAATMLLIIQSLYKKHLPLDKSIENIDVLNAIDEIIDEENNSKDESKEILEDKHLKELLHEKLSTDTKLLQLDTLINKIQHLLANYVQYIAVRRETDEVRTAVMRLVPILEQVVLFVQYFVSQKVAVHRVSCKMLSVLLKIFSDLAMKGYVKFISM